MPDDLTMEEIDPTINRILSQFPKSIRKKAEYVPSHTMVEIHQIMTELSLVKADGNLVIVETADLNGV